MLQNWDKYLNRIYKAKMLSVKKWQIFSSSAELGLTKVCLRDSKVLRAASIQEGLKKNGVTDQQQNDILLERPTPFYDTHQPGLQREEQEKGNG
jgi:hypothetical protein